ncbi:hypothetical protein BY996DRAFT_6540421 [Phakopsora pachyrhizi]|uniref:Uncharacterized protein n=1 Tax=Phakopsora pachyrhizi TaxID=170000 RepID=A0AAV0BBP4_PHAPC|nr:hypothetical protein BY996DRAFT_6540421 [Phakopsora pachyrhizi]CAH7684644.1 hypothetical protein PPACK8108_LOCUS18983 [Phakopsora pachyrhizi]
MDYEMVMVKRWDIWQQVRNMFEGYMRLTVAQQVKPLGDRVDCSESQKADDTSTSPKTQIRSRVRDWVVGNCIPALKKDQEKF